ncbi:MAG: phosphatase PAP2 family protein [Actinomycetota bacterium]|nr:phosphatase PAP2 family protein [Actinomycetota bacterium]
MSFPAQRSGVALPRVRRAPKWLREVALIAVIYVGYELSRGVTKSTFAIAKGNGWDILNWERAWHLDPEQLLTHGLISVTPLAVVAAYFYSTMHYVITPVVLIWMYRRHQAEYRPARTALAISTVIGLLGFYALPTAPPRLLRQAGIPDTLFHVRHWGWWGGEGSVPRGLGSLTNQFAAMPSMHVGWALWCGVLLWRYAAHRWARWAGVAYPVFTTVIVLATGNHYLLDAVAGALVVAMGALITVAFTRTAGLIRSRGQGTDEIATDVAPADTEPYGPAAASHSLFGAVSGNADLCDLTEAEFTRRSDVCG